MTNPLTNILTECRHVGEDEDTALLKLFMILQGSDSPACVVLAMLWEERYGEPTWDSLEKWCEDFAADPANAEIMLPIIKRHADVMAGASAEVRERLAEYLPE